MITEYRPVGYPNDRVGPFGMDVYYATDRPTGASVQVGRDRQPQLKVAPARRVADPAVAAARKRGAELGRSLGWDALYLCQRYLYAQVTLLDSPWAVQHAWNQWAERLGSSKRNLPTPAFVLHSDGPGEPDRIYADRYGSLVPLGFALAHEAAHIIYGRSSSEAVANAFAEGFTGLKTPWEEP
jgi:hypothetical protein